MPINNAENKKEENVSLQPYISGFVVLAAVALIFIPLLPTLKSNLLYSFSGEKPKIYWYLSRSGGFVTLTILWASMALGLGITNKTARLWPGAPTAFAVHQYASLLGLAFAAYHGLVLMGDHYTDFSLPRLITPFSIAYKTFWIGLGQVCFYAWLAVVISFYIRQWIGQRTWRVIHYINFLTYIMGFMHALKSGTDSYANWAQWYFWLSGGSLLFLLCHRIYETALKNKIAIPELTLPNFGFKKRRAMSTQSTSTPASTPAPSVSRLRTLPRALIQAQTRNSPAAVEPTRTVAATSQLAMETKAPVNTTEAKAQPTIIPAHLPASMTEKPVIHPASETNKMAVPSQRVKAMPSEMSTKSTVKFREPTTLPIPELQKKIREKKEELQIIFTRIRQSMHSMPVEPTTPNRRRTLLSESSD